MNHNLLIWNIIALIVISMQGTILAQNAVTKADVRAMFPGETRDLWINYLSGTIGGSSIVDMIIGTDGHTCKGLYTLRSSGITFNFEGEEIDKQLKLVELNNESRMTGFLYGNYDGQRFDGQWMNSKKNLKLPIKLVFVNSFEDFKPVKKGLDQWIQNYSGKFNGVNCSLSITRNEDLYYCSLVESNKRYKDLMPAKEDRVVMLQLNFPKTVLDKTWAVIDTLNESKIDIMYLDENGYEILSPLKREAALFFDCYEYSDYSCRLECIRPVSGNRKFDLWMEDTFQDWLASNTKKLKAIDTDEIATQDRWSQTAHGWVDIDLFLEDIISGTIYMQSSWQKETNKISFIYDLSNGKELVLQDVFKSDFDSKGYFKNVIPAKRKEILWKPEIKQWVEKQKFDKVTLTEVGISFKSDFSTIYGEEEILVKYTDLEANIKNKSILKQLLGK